MQGWLGWAHLPPQIATVSSTKALSCDGIVTHYIVVLQSTDDVGAGGAGVGGSAATGNVNGYKNVGSVGGDGAGGTGVDNSKNGRHLLKYGYNKQVCHPHEVLMQDCPG